MHYSIAKLRAWMELKCFFLDRAHSLLCSNDELGLYV